MNKLIINNKTFFILSLILSFLLNAQDKNIDSIKRQIKISKNYNETFNNLFLLGEYYQLKNSDSAFSYFNEAIENAKKNNDYYLIAKAIKEKGWTYYLLSEYEEAKTEYEKAIQFVNNGILKNSNKEKIKILKEIKAGSLRNIGVLYDAKSQYPEAINLFFQSLKIYQEIDNKSGIAKVYGTLGISYSDQKDYERALDYFNKSVAIHSKLNDLKSNSSNYVNIGNLYYELKNYDTALNYYLKAKSFYSVTNNLRGLGIILGNIGGIYSNKNNQDSALVNYKLALEINRNLGNQRLIAIDLLAIGKLYLNKMDYKTSEKYYNEVLAIAKKIEANDLLADSYLNLSIIKEYLKQHKTSLEFLKKHIELKDSLFDIESKNKSIEQEFKYDYELKKLKDSLDAQKKVEIFSVKLEKQKIELNAKRNQQIILFIGIILTLIFGLFMYKRYKISTEQKKIILHQKNEVENQKHIVEEKQKEILDSINYAKRLQEAILPPLHYINEHLPNNFVLYQPKDVVAGDFYWAEMKDNKFFIAAADCTGHGVPGAMVSVVCSNALNRTVNEFGITNTGNILDKTRELVLETFAKGNADVKDGMDISLLCIDKKNNKAFWSGANNPFWYIDPVTSGTQPSVTSSTPHSVTSSEVEKSTASGLYSARPDIKEIKADKQPIGKTDNPKPFTTHEIELKPGMQFYLFTDGYADQFGGPKGKKFKYKQLEELLLTYSNLTMQEQQQHLFDKFSEWKGDLEQVDDVCVIGVKV